MKNMKKWLSALLVCALAVCVVALTACGETEPPPPPAVGITLNPTTASVEEGKTVTITATVENSTDDPTFDSSNKAVATVVANGKTATVTAVAVGSADITATVGGKTAKCVVTVTARPAPAFEVAISGIEKISDTQLFMEDGGETWHTATLTATAEGNVTFTSSEPEIVAVATSGKTATLTANKIGVATVTVASGNDSKEIKVEVANHGLTYGLIDVNEETKLQVAGESVSGEVRIPAIAWSDDDEYFYEVVKVRGKNADTGVSGGFENNNNITSVYLGDNVTVIGDNGFRDCNALVTVNCGPKFVEVGGGSFDDCDELATFNWGESNPQRIVRCAFRFTKLTEFTVPATVTGLGDSMFQGCTLLETVKISGQITEIYNATFLNCSALKNVYIPVSVKNIGESAFGLYSAMPDGGMDLTIHYAGTEAEWGQIVINSNNNPMITPASNSALKFNYSAEY